MSVQPAHVSGLLKFLTFPLSSPLAGAAVIMAPCVPRLEQSANPQDRRQGSTVPVQQPGCGRSRWYCGSIGPIAKTRHDSAIQQFHRGPEVLSVAGRDDVVCGSPGSTARAGQGVRGTWLRVAVLPTLTKAIVRKKNCVVSTEYGHGRGPMQCKPVWMYVPLST